MSTSPLNVAIPTVGQLQDNAARLLQESLAQASQAGSGVQLSTADLELARSNVKALAFVQAMGVHGAYRYLRDFIARQAIPIKSAGAFLDGWLQTYGMARKTAAASAGAVVGTGVNGTLLPAGTLLQADDGRQYKVTADAQVAAGVVSATVIAALEGLAGDVAAGGALALVSTVSGIDSAFAVGSAAISGGADVETDVAAVYRLQQRLSNEPRGGSPADYARWALAVPSITRAWGVRNPAGPTSAGVIIAADGNVAPGLPTAGQRRLVLDYIRDPRRGPPDELHVIAFNPLVKSFTIRLTPDTTAVRVGVIAALQDLFFREATPGGRLPHSHVVEAISGVAGENNHAVLAPELEPGGEFVAPNFDDLVCLGPVTFV